MTGNTITTDECEMKTSSFAAEVVRRSSILGHEAFRLLMALSDCPVDGGYAASALYLHHNCRLSVSDLNTAVADACGAGFDCSFRNRDQTIFARLK